VPSHATTQQPINMSRDISDSVHTKTVSKTTTNTRPIQLMCHCCYHITPEIQSHAHLAWNVSVHITLSSRNMWNSSMFAISKPTFI